MVKVKLSFGAQNALSKTVDHALGWDRTRGSFNPIHVVNRTDQPRVTGVLVDHTAVSLPP
jgi:hypothetical protein